MLQELGVCEKFKKFDCDNHYRFFIFEDRDNAFSFDVESIESERGAELTK